MFYMVIVFIIFIYLDKYFDLEELKIGSDVINGLVFYNYIYLLNIIFFNIIIMLFIIMESLFVYVEGGGVIGVFFVLKVIV